MPPTHLSSVSLVGEVVMSLTSDAMRVHLKPIPSMNCSFRTIPDGRFTKRVGFPSYRGAQDRAARRQQHADEAEMAIAREVAGADGLLSMRSVSRTAAEAAYRPCTGIRTLGTKRTQHSNRDRLVGPDSPMMSRPSRNLSKAFAVESLTGLRCCR
jgi:hypothetical protein